MATVLATLKINFKALTNNGLKKSEGNLMLF